MIISHQFKAFDTDIILQAFSAKKEGKNIASSIEKNAFQFEKRFSRFKDSSELNKLNHRKSKTMKVSDQMLEVLLKAQNAYQITHGIFDPAIYPVLNNVGYDKSFDSITDNVATVKKQHTSFDTMEGGEISFKELIINKKAKTVQSPTGLKIDLGGIAKGYWVDTIKDILVKYCDSYWISAGGDLFIKGKNEDKELWEVVIENPLIPEQDMLSLYVPAEGYGIATSGIVKRKGNHNGKDWHHIIDPRTRKPVRNSIMTVTVIARTMVDADIMAKVVLILGIKKGLALVNSMHDYACVIIDRNLRLHISSALKKFL